MQTTESTATPSAIITRARRRLRPLAASLRLEHHPFLAPADLPHLALHAALRTLENQGTPADAADAGPVISACNIHGTPAPDTWTAQPPHVIKHCRLLLPFIRIGNARRLRRLARACRVPYLEMKARTLAAVAAVLENHQDQTGHLPDPLTLRFELQRPGLASRVA